MVTRRQMMARCGLGALGLSGVAAVSALEPESWPDRMPDGSAAKGMVTPSAEDAIRKGLMYLDRNRNGGSFGNSHTYRGNVAVCSLAGLAFMAAGNQPNRGKYGKVVTDALRFVLSQSRRHGRFNGYLYNPGATRHGPMYGHGFGALFLAEIYGMVHHDKNLRTDLHRKLADAIDLIVKSQNREGGWRYHPTSTDADLSVTICQIMALRSARNAGFTVPKTVVDRCVQYVKRCQNHDGSFNYQARALGHHGLGRPFARTAAGICALYSAGIYEGPEVRNGLTYLMQYMPSGGDGGRFVGPNMQYFYGHYYAAQAMWTAGGEYWKKWFPAIRDELVNSQRPDGSWSDAIDIHYATAMASIILQIPNNYLPILQK